MKNDARLYISSLSDYVEGRHVGQWFSLRFYEDGDDLFQAVSDWLDSLQEADGHLREEFAVHDYENMANLGEYPDKQDITDYIKAIENGADPGALDAFVASGNEIAECCERYYGQFETDREFAEDVAENTGVLKQVPEHLKYCFDYDRYARDLLIDDFHEMRGYYFWRH